MKIGEFVLALSIILLFVTFVNALDGSSSSYTSKSKLDFGATDDVDSLSYSNRFISGFEPVVYYRSDNKEGRFGVLEDLTTFNPIMSGLKINSSDGSNRTLQDLHCSATLKDGSNDTMNVTVKWYKNDVEYLELAYDNSYANGTFFVADLDSANTTKGENWSCSMRGFGGGEYGAWYETNNLLILNTPPVITLSNPSDGVSITNRTPLFNWSASDDDNDTLTYDINISLVASSLCTDQDRYIEDIAVTEYNFTDDLNCFYDNGDYYVWTARAKDDESNSGWASNFTFYVNALLDISLPVDSISFGNLSYMTSNNTTDGSPPPIQIQNNGNSLIKINISATDLWDTNPNPSSYYQLKIDNVSEEKNSFNWTESTFNWTNAPANNNTIFIFNLKYPDLNDSAEVDVYVEAPANEIPEAKTSILTFSSSFNE